MTTKYAAPLHRRGLLHHKALSVLKTHWFDEPLSAAEISAGEQSFAKLLEAFPEASFVYEALGALALQGKRFPLALGYFAQAMEKFPEDINGSLGRAQVLAQMNAYDEAEALYREVESRFPGDIRGYVGQAQILVQRNRYDDAPGVVPARGGCFSRRESGAFGTGRRFRGNESV